MIISIEDQTLKVEEFQLHSYFSAEIADFFQPLNSMERFAMLSSLIEIGWVASKVGKSHLASDYYEKITSNWTTILSNEFQELGVPSIVSISSMFCQRSTVGFPPFIDSMGSFN